MVNLYGFCIASGIFAGFWVANHLVKQGFLKYKLDVWKILLWLIAPGIVGARLYHVIDFWQYYQQNPLEIVKVWQGGLGIFGAIVGGILGLFLFSKTFSRKKTIWQFPYKMKNFVKLLDLAAIGLPLGQAIGRWGNFFNQELYGLSTNLPWGIRIIGRSGRFHPLFLYESLWCLGIFLFFYRLTLRKRKTGQFFFLYLLLYGFGRFWLEFLRIESWTICWPFPTSCLRMAQVVSLIMVVVALIGLIFDQKTCQNL